MKIRIKGNSVRLRLSQSEIDELDKHGIVSDGIDFGSKKLLYALQVTDVEEVVAGYNEDVITLSIPKHIADTWINSDQVGFEKLQSLGNQNELFILIEKDFQCLQPRPHEDETDLFRNPDEGKIC